MNEKARNTPLVIGAIIVPLGIALFSSSPYSLPTALFVTIVFLWFTEVIPLPVTALLVPVLATAYGVVSPNEAFAPFGNQVLFLFIGAFLLAEAMSKHGWDKRMAYSVITQTFVSTPARLIIVVALICWMLSMWISNTAACAIMLPICVGIISSLKDTLNEQSLKNFSIRILLVCAFASSIGGMATPVGSPPNVLAIEFLKKKGIHLGFIDWIYFGLPISLAMLILLILLLAYKYPIGSANLSQVKESFAERLKEFGQIKREEFQVLFCFSVAVALWLLPGIASHLLPNSSIGQELGKRLPMGGAAIIAIFPLFILKFTADGKTQPNLDWNDAKKIDWGTVLLFGGGLCLGSILQSSGLAAAIGERLFSLDSQNAIVLGAAAVLLAIVMSEFSSNTASAAIIIPIVLSAEGIFEGFPLSSLAIAVAFGASFGFMLPVSTPPNAIVFGTGRVPLREMIRSGIIFDVLGLLIISLVMLILVPLLAG